MSVLAQVVRHQPRLILGVGQGGLLAGIMGMPMVVEQAVKLRSPVDREIRDFRRSWARVAAVLAVEPQIAPDAAKHGIDELIAAVPEIIMLQTRGVHRAVVQTVKDQYSAQAKLNLSFASLIGGHRCPENEVKTYLEQCRYHLDILKKTPVALGSVPCVVGVAL